VSANTIVTSVVTGGTNSHTTVAEEANSIATDFVTQGVVGAITLNSGSGGTGSFCVNADASPDMGITVKSGQAYVTATPSSQDSQVLRARASSDYTSYTINANSSGVTKYDWIYLSVDATKANDPASDASDVTSIYTSRSSSNTTDNGSPPTYGLLLAIVTVANGASSITNSNITDKRFNTSIGAQNGSLIVTQQATGDDAKIQAAGTDANINIDITPKGTGIIVTPDNVIAANSLATSAIQLGYASITSNFTGTATSFSVVTGLSVTVTVPSGGRSVKISVVAQYIGSSHTAGASMTLDIYDVTAGAEIGQLVTTVPAANYACNPCFFAFHTPASGSRTYEVRYTQSSSATFTMAANTTAPAFILVELI
jgi:hypothetical protein